MSIFAPRSPYEEAWQQWNYGGGARRGEPRPNPAKFRRPREAPEAHPGKEELAYKKRWPNDIPVGPSRFPYGDQRNNPPGGQHFPSIPIKPTGTQLPNWMQKTELLGKLFPSLGKNIIPFGNTSPKSPMQDMGRFGQRMRVPVMGGMGGIGIGPSMGLLGGLAAQMFQRGRLHRPTPEQFNSQVRPGSLTRMQPNGTIAY